MDLFLVTAQMTIQEYEARVVQGEPYTYSALISTRASKTCLHLSAFDIFNSISQLALGED